MADDLKKNLLIAIYSQNEQYHDAKDNVIWVLGTVYLGFALATFAWLFTNESLWTEHRGWVVLLLVFVFLPAYFLIGWQNRLKCRSLKKAALFHDLIKKLGKPQRELTYTDLERLESPGKVRIWEALRFKNGPGALVLYNILLLFLLQIAVVICLGNQVVAHFVEDFVDALKYCITVSL